MRIGVDVGGTFTDLVAIAPDGSLTIRKVGTTPAVWSRLGALLGAFGLYVAGVNAGRTAELTRASLLGLGLGVIVETVALAAARISDPAHSPSGTASFGFCAAGLLVALGPTL